MSFDLWHSANPDAGVEEVTLDPPADGEYDVTLVEGFAGIGKQSGQAFVSLVFEAPDGYRWKVIGQFKSQSQANMTKRMVRDLGIDVDSLHSLDEIKAALEGKAGQFFHVTVKTNGGFRNTYVDGPAQGQQIASDVTPVAAADDVAGEPAADVQTNVGDDNVPFRAVFPEARELRYAHNPFD